MVELNGDRQGSDNGSNLLVRFPIYVQRWGRTPEAKTRLQWQLIEENFKFDYVVGMKWVMHSLRYRWRAYKYKLRCDHFYPNKRMEEILANLPPNVDSTDWTAFVHHYKEDRLRYKVHKIRGIEQNLKSRMPVVAKVTQGEVAKCNDRNENWEDRCVKVKLCCQLY
ncbi:uncharacterized protein LOC107018302 [Solanum pennellii]|uniref:Uncharacterized protein LOC107018302 n=1 Tax=Solanum pennellii TaxID=28526 RepID=A0ABM1V972_SOLPN|nr:uncharacterized protein LOC107018302 [Solanum pennellii]